MITGPNNAAEQRHRVSHLSKYTGLSARLFRVVSVVAFSLGVFSLEVHGTFRTSRQLQWFLSKVVCYLQWNGHSDTPECDFCSRMWTSVCRGYRSWLCLQTLSVLTVSEDVIGPDCVWGRYRSWLCLKTLSVLTVCRRYREAGFPVSCHTLQPWLSACIPTYTVFTSALTMNTDPASLSSASVIWGKLLWGSL